MGLEIINKINNSKCKCGKEHIFTSDVIIGEGVIKNIPQVLERYNAKKVFVIADKNTYAAAGREVCEIIEDSGVSVVSYLFNKDELEPDESNVGLAIMHFDVKCDVVIGVGSGVINDIGKIVASVSDKPYMIVGTAPSMDGYASDSSSMTRDGLKISLPSKSADVIIGDVDILCKAPIKMMVSGLGDMLAKYVSICEWRIANLILGEYYCEEIADLVRLALKRCIDNADGLLKRDKAAVTSVFEGLVICGAAMKYAGVSRPASGVEHYLSHVWDMRGIEFNTPVDFHGIQCAIGTLIAVRVYEQLFDIKPDREKALAYVDAFDFGKWSDELRSFLGKAAQSMIALEEKEHKYSKSAHKQRLEVIIDNWDNILNIAREELPSSEQLERLLDTLGAPKTLEEIGLDSSLLPMTFKSSKDIRDKYVLPRLVWDLGIIDEMKL